ncbi:MAG: hypothetical protein ABIK26_00600 [Candidatus Omnitrophota bacterium]
METIKEEAKMTVKTKFFEPITIDQPTVLMPLEAYQELLVEAGHMETPVLNREISDARKRFKNGKAMDWKKLKNEIS